MKPPSCTSSLLSKQVRSAHNVVRGATAKAASCQTQRRRYAQVGSTTYLGEPPSSPQAPVPPRHAASSTTPSAPRPSARPTAVVRPFDAHVLSELQKTAAAQRSSGPPSGSASDAGAAPLTLPELVEQYMHNAGRVLDASLPYESRPGAARRAAFDASAGTGGGASTADGALAVVAHAVHDRTGKHRVAYSSAFAIAVPGVPKGRAVYVTCAHTLEEIRHDPVMRATRPAPAPPFASPAGSDALLSGSFVIAGSPTEPTFHPVSAVPSAMHRGDLLLLSAPAPATVPSGGESAPPLRTLPVNPYPVHPGTPVRAHFVADKPPPAGAGADGWTPWVGGTWRKWVRGTVMGYRDYAGREAKAGTYDSLAHLHFDPPPTPGSSGGPIIDEESGSVIGVMLGTQLVSQVEGTRGWGVPSEMIFEMFSLPGLNLKGRA